MTQEATSYKIWKPEHDGHAPPNWREGMKVAADGLSWTVSSRGWGPGWWAGQEYKVPAEALNSPNDDASDAKPTDPRKSVHEALAILRDYSPDELAKHGITLAPERDWATELWAELLEAWDMHETAELVRRGAHGDAFVGPINLIRTRFEQMIAERNKRND